MSHCDHSLIPNATPFERELESHAAQKYCRVNADIIRDLHDPMKCPLEFLPWLAYALSVDLWNDRWPEAIKRAVCANALEMHRHKGTHGGVMDALAALGVRPEIVYWHEMQPPGEPGTMDVTLWINTILNPAADMIIGAEAVRDILEQLNRSKRASIHYKFTLAVEASPSGVCIGTSGQLTTHQRTDAKHLRTATRATAPAGVGIGTSGQLTTHQRTDAKHLRTATRATAPSGVGIGTSGQLTTHQRTDAKHLRTATRATAPAGVGISGQMTTHLRLEASL
jgi:phage tail P2-like protein